MSPQRQQVSLLAQRLSGGPAVSEMQNHMLAGSGQVSGMQWGAMPSGLPGSVLGSLLGRSCVGQQLCCPLGNWGLWGGNRGVGEGARHKCPSLFQERSGTDPAQSRPNPPTFAQGVISEY